MSETVTTAAPSSPAQGSSGGSSQGSQTTSQSPASPAQGSNAFGGGTAQGTSQATEKQAGETAENTPPAKRYLEADHEEALVKVKIDGVEQELSIKELKRLSSLERASQKRMSEAAKQQKQFQQLMAKMQEDPAAVMKQFGKDPDSWAEELLARKYELAQMDPVQRENLELKSRIEAQERLDLQSKQSVINDIRKLSDKVPENLERYSKEDLANYRDHLVSVDTQAQQALQDEMIQAWEQTKLPKHKTWANWMAMEMMAHEKRTGEPLQAKDAALKVKADYQKFNRHLLGQMDASAIQEWLGKEIVQKLMDHRVQSVTGQVAQPQRTAPAQPASDSKKPYMTELEYRNWTKQR
jgi:hypothetical protein